MSVQEWCEQRETSLMSGPNAGSSPENGEQNATRSPAATAAWGGASGSKADGRSRVLHKWQWQPEEGGEGRESVTIRCGTLGCARLFVI